MTFDIASAPYLACILLLLIGLIVGWLAGAVYRLEREQPTDDDITGIGA